MTEKMYKVSGMNRLHFIVSALSLTMIEQTLSEGDHIEECDPAYAFGVRFGSQPIYEVTADADGKITERRTDRNKVKLTFGVTEGRNFY